MDAKFGMRERSHKKGEAYQHAVKHWLVGTSFLGLDTDLFGDAYDVTKKACTLGRVVFDFSLTLRSGQVAKHVLYAECKYRNEKKGNVDTEFADFLKHAYEALVSGDNDDVDCAVFVFISNIPPQAWREFLRNRRRFCEQLDWGQTKPDGQVLDLLVNRVHVLVVSKQIVERN